MSPDLAVRAALAGDKGEQVKAQALKGLPTWLHQVLPVTVRLGSNGAPRCLCPHGVGSDAEFSWRLSLMYLRACARLWPQEVGEALKAHPYPLYGYDHTSGRYWSRSQQQDPDGFVHLLEQIQPEAAFPLHIEFNA